MIRNGYCPKAEGRGVDKCSECQFMGDDCDGDSDDLTNDGSLDIASWKERLEQ